MEYHQVCLLVEHWIHFSLHNPQVYAITSISYSTLSKLVRPLIMLSFNSSKPTKGLDVLTISPFLVIDDNTIKGLISWLSVEQEIESIAYTCGLCINKYIQGSTSRQT